MPIAKYLGPVAGALGVLGFAATVFYAANEPLTLREDTRSCLEGRVAVSEVAPWTERPCSEVLDLALERGVVERDRQGAYRLTER